MIYFKIPGPPKGKARSRTFYNPKLGRSQSITPENTVLYENLVKQQYLASDPDKKWFNKEPLGMTIYAGYPIPKSMTKKQLAEIEAGRLKPTKKPDVDNIAKIVCDALNGIAYGDDAQIVRNYNIKEYVDEPAVYVWIWEVGGEEAWPNVGCSLRP